MNEKRRKRGGDHDQKEREGQCQRLDEIAKMEVRTAVCSGSIGHGESYGLLLPYARCSTTLYSDNAPPPLALPTTAANIDHNLEILASYSVHELYFIGRDEFKY